MIKRATKKEVNLNTLSTGCSPCLKEAEKIQRKIGDRKISEIKIAEVNANTVDVSKNIEKSLIQLLCQRANCHGVTVSNKDLNDILAFDVKLNASGLATWLERR